MAVATTFTYRYVILCLLVPVVLAGVAHPRPETEVTRTQLLGSPQQSARTGRKLEERNFPTDLAAPPIDAVRGPKGVLPSPIAPNISSARFRSITAIPVNSSARKASSRPWRTVPVTLPRRGASASARFPVQSYVEVANGLVFEEYVPAGVSSKSRALEAKATVYVDDNDLLR